MPYKYNIKRIKSDLFDYFQNERHVMRVSKSKGAPVDLHRYRPNFQPWHHNEDFQPYLAMTNGVTVVSPESIWVMVGFLRHCLNIEGDFVEMGVYKGGTTAIINRILSEQNSAKHFFAYDTFEGMPETDSLKDFHREKDFADVNLASVKEYISRYSPVSRLSLVPGILPKSALETLPQRIAFVHIDLDIFEAISKSLALVYPRVSSGGVILFDDYGAPTCYGARLAVDKFFENKKEFPIVLGTSQAFIIKK